MDGVGTPIIGRPRPLPSHDTPNPTEHLHPQMRRAGIIRYSIELYQQDGHVSFVKTQFYRYNLTSPMISRIV